MRQWIIGSDKGLSLIQHPAIIWTSVVLLSIELLGTSFSETLVKIQDFMKKVENPSEIIVCKEAAILSRGRWVNSLKLSETILLL